MFRTQQSPLLPSTVEHASTDSFAEHSLLRKMDYPRPIDRYIDYFTGRPPERAHARRALATSSGRRAQVTRILERVERPA
jgi:hypothetical protein